MGIGSFLHHIGHEVSNAWHSVEKPVSNVVFPLVGATEKLGSAMGGGGGSTLSNYVLGSLGETGIGAGAAALPGLAAGAGAGAGTAGSGTIPWDIAAPGSSAAAGSSSIGSLFDTAAGASTGGTALSTTDLAKLALQGYGSLQAYQQAHDLMGMAQGADPFGPYRSQYAQQLAQLEANPSSITSLPGYQFTLNQGLDQIRREAAAKGYTGSSNLAYNLAQYAQGLAGQTYGKQVSQLAGLAGANISPAIGLSATENAYNLQNQALNNLALGFSMH